MGLIFESGLAVIALLLGWLFGVDPLSHAQLSWGALLSGVLATGPLVGGLFALESITWAPFQALKNLVEQRLVPMFYGASVAGLALLSISAGIGEEMLFRGLIQDGLGGWLGPIWGLILASLVFGMAHAISLGYFLITVAMGLYLGALYQTSGSLWAPALTHALYDFIALMYLTRENR